MLDINKLPGKQRSGVRIQSLNVRLLHPVDCRSLDGNNRLRVNHILLSLRQQLVTLPLIQSAIRLIEHVNVFLIPPTSTVIATRYVEDIQERKWIHVIG